MSIKNPMSQTNRPAPRPVRLREPAGAELGQDTFKLRDST